jgi:hypothetical protein
MIGGMINVNNGWFICLAQKYVLNNHACGLVFGYNGDKIFYQRKSGGIWSPVREL